MDLLRFIETSRILKFITSVQLRSNQQQMVPYFKDYHINDENPTIKFSKQPRDVEKMFKHFNPNTDTLDRRILWEITGRKREDDLFESSDEDDSQSGSDDGDRPPD
jgi:hypothetical protein